MSGLTRTQRTYRFELLRAGSAGILETAGTTFLLLIAVRWYHAGPVSKALIAASGSLGLLLTPVAVTLAARSGRATSAAAARFLLVGTAAFTAAAVWPVLPLYVVCSVAAMAASASVVPLLTQMYQENYPENERGRRFSRTVMVRIAMAALFSKVAGDALTGNIHWFPGLLLVFGGAMGFASFCLSQCPTVPLGAESKGHPLHSMRFVRQDRLFRRTLICWMLMGFANLMMLPLRVEYLANQKYGLELTVGTIALLTGVIPNVARLVMSPIWGYLFDHMNFFALRVTLNVGFALGILTFFTTDSFTGMVVGGIVFGISNAGGDVAWSLWVTKFAPPARVADYMSVHTFLTGIRGVLAPLAAFYLVGVFPLSWLAGFSAALIGAATLLLLPEVRWGRGARPATALVEEVSE